MRGRFTLTKQDGYVYFGNLGADSFDMPSFAVGEDRVGDTLQNHYWARTVAHDVVEHSTDHRTNTRVSVEKELQAFGASHYVRGLYDVDETASLMRWAAGREIAPAPVPYSSAKHKILGISEVRDLYKAVYENHPALAKEFSGRDYARAIAHINYGFNQKAAQFHNNKGTAWAAFDFIHHSVEALWPEFIYDDKPAVSIHFCTVQKIFRPTYIWRTL